MKLEKLESLRGFAALYVFAGHFLLQRLLPKGSLAGIPFRFGQEAVVIFFLISGFVIHYAFSRDADKSFARYFGRRFRRIYPIFIVALVLSVVLAADAGFYLTEAGLVELVGNLFMLQDFASGKPGVWVSPAGGNSALWSLSYEWWFYMLYFPITRFVAERHQLGLVVGVSSAGLASYAVAPNQISLFLMYFILWWSGVEVAKAYLRQEPITLRSQGRTLVMLALFVVALAVPCVWAAMHHESLGMGVHPLLELRHFSAALVLLTLAILWRNAGWRGFSLTLGPFSRVASISFAIYVLHMPLAVDAHYLPVGWDAGYVVVTFIAAYVLEVPFQQRVVAAMTRRRARPAVVGTA